MISLGELLSNQKNRKNSIIDQATVEILFRQAVKDEFGEVGVGYFSPELLKDKVLFVKTKSSIWSSELWLLRDKIIKKINAEANEQVLREIKVN